MPEHRVARLSPDQLAAERARAAALRQIRASQGTTPASGELWSIRPEIVDSESGDVLERSWAPVVVAVWRELGPALEVVPVSFDTDLAGPGDVLSRERLFEREFLLECWLRLPVLKEALHRRFGKVSESAWKQVAQLCAGGPAAVGESEADEARAAYRQSERLRVLFAAAGAAAAIAGSARFGDDESLRQKRLFGDRQAALIEEIRQYHPAPSPESPTGKLPIPA